MAVAQGHEEKRVAGGRDLKWDTGSKVLLAQTQRGGDQCAIIDHLREGDLGVCHPDHLPPLSLLDANPNRTDALLEGEFPGTGLDETLLPEHPGGPNRWMARKGEFHRGSKNPNARGVVALISRQNESGLGEIQLLGHRLHGLAADPVGG